MRVNYSNFDYKKASEIFNKIRLQHLGKAVSYNQIKGYIKATGIGWHTCLMPFLIKYNIIEKRRYGKTNEFYFTQDPIHYSRLKTAHSEYLKNHRSYNKRYCSKKTEEPEIEVEKEHWIVFGFVITKTW